MPALTYTNSIQNGDSLDASKVMANFNDARTVINGGIDATNITAGAITNSLISSSAAIAASKLASTTAGYVLLGTTTTGVPTWTPLSGDVTVTGGGVTAIGAGKVTNDMLAGSITYANLSISDGDIPAAKIGTLASGKILLGNSSNVATATTPSGDVTINNTGVTAIGAAKVTAAMMKYGRVTQRQGGTSGDASWITGGTTNTDTSGKDIMIQVGATGVINSTLAITFPTPYNYAPIVFCCAASANSVNAWCEARSVTTTGFTLGMAQAAGQSSTTESAFWIAIGQ